MNRAAVVRDLSTYNATVYDNVAWNRTTYGVVLINPNGVTTSGNRVHNNTSGTDRKSVSLFPGTWAGVAVQRTTVQAEAYAEGSGVATHAAGTGSVLGVFDGGDWVRYDDVDFGTGRDLLVANIGHFSVQKAISQ